MITQIELQNFQSHKHSVFDLSKGINVLCGESDNGKSAVIRAIKWVCENRPLGTDKLNSNWNSKFKENMSCKITFDNSTWVERVRGKDRNGYNYFDGKQVYELNAIGNDVPQKIKDVLKLNEVNFEYQMDTPYLISMSSPEASRYLNQIVHLDSIDNLLSVADSNKRQLNSELKIVEKDIKNCKEKLESLSWLEQANDIQKRIDKYEEVIENKLVLKDNLSNTISKYSEYSLCDYDLSEQNKLVEEIESIDIPDSSSLKQDIQKYENCLKENYDLSEQNKLVEEIENIDIPVKDELNKSIINYERLENCISNIETEITNLKKELPDICPYCGAKIVKG